MNDKTHLDPYKGQEVNFDVDLGTCLYVAPNAPRIEPELIRLTFETSSADSNLVGNIYYANYYHWQGRLIDRFFYKVFHERITTGESCGEFWCVKSNVDHLREAMPFDQIEVIMALKGLYQRGIQLHFDFYRVTEDDQYIKLAVGTYEAIWVSDPDSLTACELPEPYLAVLTDCLPHHVSYAR